MFQLCHIFLFCLWSTFLSPLWSCRIIYNECFNWAYFKNNPLCEHLSHHCQVASWSIDLPALISSCDIINNYMIFHVEIAFLLCHFCSLRSQINRMYIALSSEFLSPSYSHLSLIRTLFINTSPDSHLSAWIIYSKAWTYPLIKRPSSLVISSINLTDATGLKLYLVLYFKWPIHKFPSTISMPPAFFFPPN